MNKKSSPKEKEPKMSSFFQSSLNFAKKTLIKKGQFTTMVVGESANGELLAFFGDYSNDEEKKIFIRLIQISFLAASVGRYIFMSEAWMSETLRSKKNLTNKKFPRPSKDANKVECLIVAEINREGKKAILFEMNRDKNGNLIDLKEIKELTDFSGIMAEFLPPKEARLPATLMPIAQSFLKRCSQTIH